MAWSFYWWLHYSNMCFGTNWDSVLISKYLLSLLILELHCLFTNLTYIITQIIFLIRWVWVMCTTKWGTISHSHLHRISISSVHKTAQDIIATTASISSVGIYIKLVYNPSSNPNFLKPHSSWPISNLLSLATASKHSWLSSSDKLGHPVSGHSTQSPFDDWSWQTPPSTCG